jgi:hypothetical protein
MREELQSIIDNFSYEKGLEWFNAHVKGKFFIKDMLSKGPDEYNQLKLRKELNQALASLPEEKPAFFPTEKLLTSKPEESVKPKTIVMEHVPATREELLLDEQWKPLFKEAHYYHSQLEHIEDVEKRKVMAFKILDLMDQVEDLWRQNDFLKAHGQLPNYDRPGVEQMTVEQMFTRIRTVRSYISKAKKGKLNPDKIPEWESEIAELERRSRS